MLKSHNEMNNKSCRKKVNFKKGAYQHFLIIHRSCWSVVTWNFLSEENALHDYLWVDHACCTRKKGACHPKE
jgi:hypothetical protein